MVDADLRCSEARCAFLMLARGTRSADDEDAPAVAAVCRIGRHGEDGDRDL